MHMADKVRRLKKLCLKHGIDWICCPWDINFLVKKIISIKPNYDSVFIFTFTKKKDSSLVNNLNTINDGSSF